MPVMQAIARDPQTLENVSEASAQLEAFLESHPEPVALLHLVAEDAAGKVEVGIPRQAVSILAETLAQLARGNDVTLAPRHSELTTQEAADLLNVSRPYLIQLLDSGKIPHRRVGNRRRVRLEDLLAYKRRDEAKRRQTLAKLTAEAQELGFGY